MAPKNVESVDLSKQAAYWHVHVEQWKRSGMSLSAYARQHSLSVASLSRWRLRFDAPQTTIAAEKQNHVIVPVPFTQSTGDSVRSAPFILHLGGTCRLEISADFSSQALMRLLQCLERRA